jgi:hypothetical protein
MTTPPSSNNLTLEKLFPKGTNIVLNNNDYVYQLSDMDIKTGLVSFTVTSSKGFIRIDKASRYTVKNPQIFFNNVKTHLQNLKEFDKRVLPLTADNIAINNTFVEILQFFIFSCSENSLNLESYDPAKKSYIYIRGNSIRTLSYLYYLYLLDKGEQLLDEGGLPHPSAVNINFPSDFKIDLEPEPSFIRNLCPPLTICPINTPIFKLLLLIIFMLIAYIVYKLRTKRV